MQPWEYYDRAQLHASLLAEVTASNGVGQPVTIKFETCVVSVEPSTASVEAGNGATFGGDVVLVADGSLVSGGLCSHMYNCMG